MSTDTLRLYEKKGLLPKARRSGNGYREYSEDARQRAARLVRQAVAIGFTLAELAQILRVRDQGGIPCRDVRALGGRKLEALDEASRNTGASARTSARRAGALGRSSGAHIFRVHAPRFSMRSTAWWKPVILPPLVPRGLRR